jgi:hypothetical protein
VRAVARLRLCQPLHHLGHCLLAHLRRAAAAAAGGGGAAAAALTAAARLAALTAACLAALANLDPRLRGKGLHQSTHLGGKGGGSAQVRVRRG